MVAAALVGLGTTSMMVPLSTASAEDAIHFIGSMRMPFKTGEYSGGSVVGSDSARRRLYYFWTSTTLHLHAAEYDLHAAIPGLLRDADLGSVAAVAIDSYNTSLDTKRMIAYQVQSHAIRVVDLKTLTSVATWNLDDRLPRFSAFGVTFSSADDLVYLVGVFGEADLQDITASGNRSAAIVALHPSDGSLAWYKPVRECAEVMKIPKGGAFVGRSTVRSALYLFCTQTAAIGQVQGQSGLLRIGLPPRPKDATTLDMAQHAVDVFPVSGSYHAPSVSGVAGIDLKTDRVFVQSQDDKTPGAFVFDGRLDAWLGQIPAPGVHDYGYPSWRGIDAGSGRYYIASSGTAGCTTDCKSYIVATDGRALPVQAGTEHYVPGSITSLLEVDPPTRRMFATYYAKNSSAPVIAVFRDAAPVAAPPDPVDYDAGTSDARESASSYVYYGGSADGFGTSAVAVGGSGSVLSFGGPLPLPLSVAPGTRGLMTARVSNVNVGPTGAGAAASAVVGDVNTDQEFRNQTGQAWPYPMVACLDGGGDAKAPTSSVPGGDVAIECNLGHGRATASATYGSSSAGVMKTGSSSVTTSVTRDATNGLNVSVTAEARGIGFDAGPAGSVSISRALTSVTSKARGHSKTAAATWTRTITGVVVRDATGTPTFTSPGCETKVAAGKRSGTDTCAPLVEQLNRVAPDRLRFTFPMADVTATPKGAFAGVGQTDADYYQEQVVDDQGVTFIADSVAQRPVPALRVVAYNDRTERSRLVLQFAAAEASSIYQVQPAPPGYPTFSQGSLPPVDDPITVPPGGGIASPSPGGGNPTQGSNPGNPNSPQTLPQLSNGITGLLRRPLGEAALTGAMLGLFGTALLTVWRRHRLVVTLEEHT